MVFKCSNDIVHYGIWSMATTLGLANLVRISPSLRDEILYVENHYNILKGCISGDIDVFETMRSSSAFDKQFGLQLDHNYTYMVHIRNSTAL
jgi:hypothetical protein